MLDEREKEKLYGGYKLQDFPAGESAHIEQLVAAKQEESHTLEYKSVRALPDKVNMCREICSFLNSEGGVIIVGVEEEENNEAGYKRPDRIEGTTEQHSRQRLQDTIIGGIAPSPNFEHFQIHEFPDPGAPSQKHGYVIFVPRSYVAPHQVMQRGVYYKRGWAGCVPMLHYEIMDMVGARQRPCLTIEPICHHIGRRRYINEHSNKWPMGLWIRVKNVGNAVARNVSARVVGSGRPFHARHPEGVWRKLVWEPEKWAFAWEPTVPILPDAEERIYIGDDVRVNSQDPDVWWQINVIGLLYTEGQDPTPFGVYVRGHWREGRHIPFDEDKEMGSIPSARLSDFESGVIDRWEDFSS